MKIYHFLQPMFWCLFIFFFLSCSDNQQNKPVTRLDNGIDKYGYDTVKFKKVYNQKGYLLLVNKEEYKNDSLAIAKNIVRIPDDPASRMVRYFKNTKPIESPTTPKNPIVIDFDFTTVAELIRQLDGINTEDDSKKAFRVYLARYDSKALNTLYASETTDSRRRIFNYTTAVLIGLYDGSEVNNAINLGNLCPPNCIVGATPNPAKSRIFKMSNERIDVPSLETVYNPAQ